MPGPQTAMGAPSWLIHDPIAHKFHAVSHRAFEILKRWRAAAPAELLEALRFAPAELEPYEESDVEDMAKFLYQHKLTAIPPGLDIDGLTREEEKANPPWWSTVFHKYVFFRVPLFRPQKFLSATAPFIAPLLTRPFAIFTVLCGLIGAIFAARQWDVFWATFLHFLTFEGLIFYGLTLAVLKVFHELGHAFIAHKYGTRVPIIGVAFIVLFPLMYTDTTDAWRLTSNRKRLMIDAGGMLAELSIACFALLAWSFLPDGPWRSAAFFVATTSWGLSLMVNLNPMMRFDGYYLVSDLVGMRNLQEIGFATGRWKMRETLFGLGAPHPHPGPRRWTFWLCVYAYSTWIYRFFLFIGIALIIHHMFPKAIGIILFTIEILFFIVRPIWAELKIWKGLIMTIVKRNRTWISVAFGCGALAVLFLPWQSRVSAPAMMQPSLQTAIHPLAAGIVDQIYVKNGDTVAPGQLILRMRSDDLDFTRAAAMRRLALLNAQLDRRSADARDRHDSHILIQSALKEKATLRALDRQEKMLEIRAPHAGIIYELSPALHQHRTIEPQFTVARLVSPNSFELLSFAAETKAARLSVGARFTFIADDAMQSAKRGHLEFIAPTSEAELTEVIFASEYRGPIAVTKMPDGSLRPTKAILRLKGTPDEPRIDLAVATRGVAHFDARRQSPALAIWRRVSHILLRETDF